MADQPNIPGITCAEIASLKATKNSTEWDKLCDEIKKSRGGQYPPDWYPKIMMTGVAAEAQSNWSN